MNRGGTGPFKDIMANHVRALCALDGRTVHRAGRGKRLGWAGVEPQRDPALNAEQ